MYHIIVSLTSYHKPVLRWRCLNNKLHRVTKVKNSKNMVLSAADENKQTKIYTKQYLKVCVGPHDIQKVLSIYSSDQ